MTRLVFKSVKLRPPPKVRVREVVNPVKPALKRGPSVMLPSQFEDLPVFTPTVRPPPRVANVSNRAADLDAKAKSRERYRNRAGVELVSCLDNLAQLEDTAKMHTVTFPNGSVREIPAFTLTAAGEPLETSGATITRWVKRGMLPEPVLETSRGLVYHIEEVRSFIRIVGKHQNEFKQYRDDHEAVKDEIFAANASIRKGLFSTK